MRRGTRGKGRGFWVWAEPLRSEANEMAKRGLGAEPLRNYIEVRGQQGEGAGPPGVGGASESRGQ